MATTGSCSSGRSSHDPQGLAHVDVAAADRGRGDPGARLPRPPPAPGDATARARVPPGLLPEPRAAHPGRRARAALRRPAQGEDGPRSLLLYGVQGRSLLGSDREPGPAPAAARGALRARRVHVLVHARARGGLARPAPALPRDARGGTRLEVPHRLGIRPGALPRALRPHRTRSRAGPCEGPAHERGAPGQRGARALDRIAGARVPAPPARPARPCGGREGIAPRRPLSGGSDASPPGEDLTRESSRDPSDATASLGGDHLTRPPMFPVHTTSGPAPGARIAAFSTASTSPRPLRSPRCE